MKWFSILLCFAVVQFVCCTNVKLVYPDSYSDDDDVTLEFEKITGNVSSCDITTNKGINITLDVNKNYDNEKENLHLRLELRRYYNPEYYILNVRNGTADLNGKWTVKLNTQEGITMVEEFYIQIKKIKGNPNEEIRLYEGQDAIFKYSMKFDNLETCFLINKDDSNYNILSEENSHLRINESNVCGVRINIDKNYTHYSYWMLYASDLKSTLLYSTEITLHYIKKPNNESTPEYFQLGKKHVIKFSPNENYEDKHKMTYCQLQDPTGKFLPAQSSCNYEIPFVTKFHGGLWKIFYGLEGSIDTMETTKEIILYDQVVSSVTLGENNQINVLCQVRGNWYNHNNYHRVTKCLLTTPKNKTFSVTPGIGNEKYEYYGRGERLGRDNKNPTYPDTFDCGVSIISPSKEDFGIWKCAIDVGNEIIGTIINVKNLARSINQENTAVKSKVFAQKGHPFTIMCSASMIIDYCWMLSPNGTRYFVSKNVSSSSDLMYKGSGLEFGECGAVIEVADDTDAGEWSCRMGVFNSTEISTAVSVSVKDSLLMADENVIDIVYKKPTILKCRVLPDYDNTINYCRWIRPDGTGIYNNVDNKYVTESTLSTCQLTIQEINVERDIGSWYCVAGITGREMKEASTRIAINYSAIGLGGIVSITIAITLLVITTITLFIIIVRKRRSLQPQDEKVLYYKS